MQNFEKMKELYNQADKVRNIKTEFDREVSNPSVDKYNLGFFLTSNCNNTPILSLCPISLVGYTGFYGHSSVSAYPRQISEKLFKEYFPKALNNLMQEVFDEMARLMEKEAHELTLAAKADLEEKQEALREMEKALGMLVE